MSQTLERWTRMDGVQAPIIPVIGELIRQAPGTISLGQGVVHYGPPEAAIAAARAALAQPATHEYQDGSGLPALVEQIAHKLRAENGVDVAGGQARTIHVAKQRLYTLADFPRAGDHVLRLTFTPGVSGFAFTFG